MHYIISPTTNQHTHMYQQLRRTGVWALFCGAVLALAVLLSFLRPPEGADISHCCKVWMYPLYAGIRSFDENHTKFARKFLLYLYREQGVDKIPESEHDGFRELSGSPALFIPGNAGSYRQVRLIAAETLDLHAQTGQGNSYDFFAADFNEDFTAFHGRTLLDQAEYLNDAISFILSLYAHSENKPTSVVIVAHSMGGFVARTMLSLPNYPENSVNTILTLSSPHSAAPLTFDADILKLYSAVDRFWYGGFHNASELAELRLKDVSLVSITGGASDAVLPADYTTLGFLVPRSHGFTVFTTGIPDVWTPTDHLAIVWCGQLRHKIAQLLLDISAQTPQRTLPLAERMQAMEKVLLPFPELTPELSSSEEFSAKLPSHSKKISSLHASEQAFAGPGNLAVVLSGQTDVLLCNKHTETCSEITDLTEINIPTPDHFQPCSDNQPRPLKAHRIPLKADQLVLLRKNQDFSENLFAIGQVAQPYENSATLSASLAQLLMWNHVKVPKWPVANVHVAGAWSSVVAYKVKISSLGNSPKFIPMVRQWRKEPYESKWHVNAGSAVLTLTTHGIAPYTPFKRTNQGFNLEFWKPEDTEMEFSIKIDIFASLKLLVLRYRIALVLQCLFAAAVVFAVQLRRYSQNGKFPTFMHVHAHVTSPKPLLLVFLGSCFLSLATRNDFVQAVLDFLDPVLLQDKNELNRSPDPHFHVNGFYMGLEEAGLCWMGFLFFLVAMVINFTVISVFRALAAGVSRIPQTPLISGSWKRKAAATGLLLLLVPIWVPYQFAYVIAFGIQVVNTLKLAKMASFHYHVTFLLLMAWVLPVNVPVLVVFVKNLNINWTTPFSSHHNFMAVAPILALVQLHNHKPEIVPSGESPKKTAVLVTILAYLAFYALVYGVRHTFWLHHLFNFYCGAVLVLWLQ